MSKLTDINDGAANTICQGIACLLPKRIAYWVLVRMIAHATQGKFSHDVIFKITATEVLTRWNEKEPDEHSII